MIVCVCIYQWTHPFVCILYYFPTNLAHLMSHSFENESHFYHSFWYRWCNMIWCEPTHADNESFGLWWSWYVSVYQQTTAGCDLMLCCFVPAFQVKERSERTERKVSTALFLLGDCVFQGNQWGFEIWSFFLFCCKQTLTVGLSDIIPYVLSHLHWLTWRFLSHCLFHGITISHATNTQNTPQWQYLNKSQTHKLLYKIMLF